MLTSIAANYQLFTLVISQFTKCDYKFMLKVTQVYY